MEAVRLHPNTASLHPYSEINPAPSSALKLDSDIPIPQPSKPGELLIRVEATTVIRDSLTWPETYLEEYKIMGNDFAGTVVAVYELSKDSPFKAGDEVYGMTSASRAGTWSEYAVVLTEEASLKPKSLSWIEAAAVPLSALTAYQALFEKAELKAPDFSNAQELRSLRNAEVSTVPASVLITGSTGSVGLYAVQLAKLAGMHVVAATRSKVKNKDYLERLGADEVVEYNDLGQHLRRYQTIIETVGGDVLKTCWSLVQETGTIVAIESASYNFAEEHRKLGLADGAGKVKAIFFVVSPSKEQLERLSLAFDLGLMEAFVACEMPLSDIRSAYDVSMSATTGRGKIVLVPRSKSVAQEQGKR